MSHMRPLSPGGGPVDCALAVRREVRTARTGVPNGESRRSGDHAGAVARAEPEPGSRCALEEWSRHAPTPHPGPAPAPRSRFQREEWLPPPDRCFSPRPLHRHWSRSRRFRSLRPKPCACSSRRTRRKSHPAEGGSHKRSKSDGRGSVGSLAPAQVDGVPIVRLGAECVRLTLQDWSAEPQRSARSYRSWHRATGRSSG